MDLYKTFMENRPVQGTERNANYMQSIANYRAGGQNRAGRSPLSSAVDIAAIMMAEDAGSAFKEAKAKADAAEEQRMRDVIAQQGGALGDLAPLYSQTDGLGPLVDIMNASVRQQNADVQAQRAAAQTQRTSGGSPARSSGAMISDMILQSQDPASDGGAQLTPDEVARIQTIRDLYRTGGSAPSLSDLLGDAGTSGSPRPVVNGIDDPMAPPGKAETEPPNMINSLLSVFGLGSPDATSGPARLSVEQQSAVKQARDAISQGAPRDAVLQRLQAMGVPTEGM